MEDRGWRLEQGEVMAPLQQLSWFPNKLLERLCIVSTSPPEELKRGSQHSLTFVSKRIEFQLLVEFRKSSQLLLSYLTCFFWKSPKPQTLFLHNLRSNVLFSQETRSLFFTLTFCGCNFPGDCLGLAITAIKVIQSKQKVDCLLVAA